eukprot:COSAG05_NODE_784_length_7362_cov_36.913810_2_plen_62_part_00
MNDDMAGDRGRSRARGVAIYMSTTYVGKVYAEVVRPRDIIWARQGAQGSSCNSPSWLKMIP